MKAGEYVWDDSLTWEFLQLYRNNLDKFRDPMVRNKDLYSRICSDLLEKYPNEPLTTQLLTKKFFNLKRTHEKIFMKKCSMVNYDVQWKFFDTMTKLLSSSAPNDVVIISKNDTAFKYEYAWKDNVTYQFLDLYLERIEEFKNPKIRNKTLFSSIANSLTRFFPDLPLSENVVQKKFYNMKRTYLDIIQKKAHNKKYPINWKFFNKVHAIMTLTEQIKVEHVTYEYDEETDFEDQSSAKRFKKELIQTDLEDINFEEYVEYENVEYEVEEGVYEEKQDLRNKGETLEAKFDIEVDQLEEDIDNERLLEEEIEEELEEGEEGIELHLNDDVDVDDDDKHDESGHLEDQQHSSELTNEVFTSSESPSTELTPFMKAKLDIEAKKIVLLEKIYNIQTERTDIDRDSLRVQKENNELLRKLLKVMSSSTTRK
ncbi:hypothetical protein ACFFRR_003223 [Megaselia abdita]